MEVRYRGLAKNTAQIVTLFALSSLCMARRQLTGVRGSVRLQGPQMGFGAVNTPATPAETAAGTVHSRSSAQRLRHFTSTGSSHCVVQTFLCATGITEYLRNDETLEVAQHMANHESARTTGLYDDRSDQINLDEVERILI